MKRVFKITTIALCLVLVFLVTGCGKKNTSSTTKKEKSKGNCTVYECISKLDSSTSLEKVNEVIGFEGEKESEKDGETTYKWKLNSKDSVSVTIYNTSSTVKIDFDKDSIKNKKVTFSKFKELEASLKNRETISYDQVKEKLGGVDGTLIEVSSLGVIYEWVDKDGGYLDVSFNKDKTKCTTIIGKI